MSHRRIVLLFPVLLPCLAGCADWPDLPDPPGIADAPAPRIAPLPDLPGPATAETAALQDETSRLQARATGLRARAAGIGTGP